MIRAFSPFPYVTPSRKQHSGFLVRINRICQNCATKECVSAYAARSVGMVQQCFQGLNYVLATDFTGEDVVWNGFLLIGTKYPKNHRELLRDGYQLEPSSITHAQATFAEGGQVHLAAIEGQKRGESRALHDLKHLVSAMSRVVETRGVRDASDKSSVPSDSDVELMKSTIRAVYNILGALKNQIEMSDYILAPDATEMVREDDIDVFKLFEKNVHIYNVLATQQDKLIEIRSTTGYIQGLRRLRQHFALLPAILLQNAIKYSIDGSTTTVEVANTDGKLTVAVRSVGPLVPATDRNRIWKLGEQYVHPNDTSKGGSGYGLYLARRISESTGFTIRYEAEFFREERGIPIGENRFVLQEV